MLNIQPSKPFPQCAEKERLTEESEVGQATAEYALVILGAAAIAGVLLAWAVKSSQIEKLFDAVIQEVISKF